MALTFTFIDSGGGEPPLATDVSFNPPNSAALALLVAIHSSTPAQIAAPSGCKPTWTRKCEFQRGDWGCVIFVGTGTTTNQAITFSTSGDAFGFEWMVVQIAADGTLSFPANASEATGSGTSGMINLGAFASSANRSLSLWLIESRDGTTPGANQVEIFDGVIFTHQGFVEYSTAADTSVDCSFSSGVWGGGAFEVSESTSRGRLIGGKLVGGNLVVTQ